MPKQTHYNVGIYVRLSKDDERAGESLSIENQKLILTKYCAEQGWNIVDTYVDCGYSGTSFGRPDHWVKNHLWSGTHIKTMLHNPTYLGHLAQMRTTTVSYKTHKTAKRDEADRVIFENKQHLLPYASRGAGKGLGRSFKRTQLWQQKRAESIVTFGSECGFSRIKNKQITTGIFPENKNLSKGFVKPFEREINGDPVRELKQASLIMQLSATCEKRLCYAVYSNLRKTQISQITVSFCNNKTLFS